MKALLIAEKPSLMREIREVYQKMSHPDEIHFASFVGHVVALKEPEDYKEEWGRPWRLEVLPMIPEKFEFKPIESSLDVFKKVRDELKSGKYDYVINACDAGREGELIFYAFYKTIGCKLPVKRLWASDTTEATLKDALLNLIDDKEPSLKRLKEAAQFRAYFDWLLGMNLSRAFSLKTKSSVALGRVMTPTLAIVVQRELEIMNFKPQDYWEVEAEFAASSGQYKGIWLDAKTGERRIFDKKRAEGIVQSLGKEGIVESVEKQRKKNYAPTLHSLLELQKEAGKAFGYTAEQVLNIAQVLYEQKKLLTYPRTESRFLPRNLAKKIPEHLKVLENIPEVKDVVKEILANPKRIEEIMNSKKYVDDKKVTDHHAIIPTDTKPNLSALTKEERNIYLLVVKRLLSIFMDPYVVDKTTVITKVGDNVFKSTGSTVVDWGYMKLYKDQPKQADEDDDDKRILPPLKKGQEVTVKDVSLLEKQTKPPQRYDDPGLLQAMANAGGFVDDEELKTILKETAGLGTSATRAAIIEKLVEKKMIARKGKQLYATQFGIDIINALKGHDITSPELTAKWEIKLKQIEEGSYDPKKFYKEMLDYTRSVTKHFMDTIENTITQKSAGGDKKKQMEVLGKCPKCGSDVVEGKSYYFCTQYKQSCDFIFSKEIAGAKLTKTDAKKLLSGKETKQLTITLKSGEKRKVKFVLNEEGKLEFAGQKTGQQEKVSVGKCPKCSKSVWSLKDYYVCDGYKKDCDFVQKKELMGATITERDMKNILSGKQTRELTFTWKNGKKGKARLKWENDKITFVFS